MKLYVIYIGGAHPQSLIELHDMRFVVADTIENTYPQLRREWWGIPESLHLDAYGLLNYADGFNVLIKKTPPPKMQNKLYFLNLGGYDSQKFTELHENIFIVAEDEKKAKSKALEKISHWTSPHRDYQYDIENILDVTQLMSNQDIHLHLEATQTPQTFQFVCQYTPIGREVGVANVY